MTKLQGIWLSESQGLFIWGETWRTHGGVMLKKTPSPHPLTLSEAELASVLTEHAISNDQLSHLITKNLTLPTQQVSAKKFLPLLSQQTPADPKSVSLKTWRVSGYYLSPEIALHFLDNLSLETSGSLEFWSQLYSWVNQLLARSKFLPTLQSQQAENAITSWQPLFDAPSDQTRLQTFAQQMPNSCRAHNLNDSPQALILDFLSTLLDCKIRLYSIQTFPAVTTPLLKQWFLALSSQESSFSAEGMSLRRLEKALTLWTEPIQDYLGRNLLNSIGQHPFRPCFRLLPPSEDKENWFLEYGLQARDDQDCFLNAQTIWNTATEKLIFQGRRVTQPQETLLQGLGLALRLYPPIHDSLQTATPTGCSLDPIQAYEFIRASAWRLSENGFGILLPPGLTPGEGERRLGVKVQAQAPKKGQKLGLQSLLNYKWELAVDEETLSPDEFKQLLDQQSPLVEVNGKWLALQPSDVKAAQNLLQASNEAMDFSVEDAVRLSSGETQTMGKLPIVDFEASGSLQELITNLSGNQSLKPIATPKGFRGELRPYQARGAGWLAFLQQWGLGACLADDMGLGKCVSPETLVFVNGNLHAAEEIWNQFAVEEIEDGEGVWAKPSQSLWVNAIDNSSGKIVPASMIRLYRQKVQEKLRKIHLKDGETITITQQHKLLTSEGWTNQLRVGDYVAVPAKYVWQGKSVDSELVEFLAWQIAEGYEHNQDARLSISQNSIATLNRLYNLFNSLAQRYQFQTNSPKIHYKKCDLRNGFSRTPCLSLCSRSYQMFLEGKGYTWGQRSKDKVIPDFIMNADLEGISLFIRHYFDAEGSVNEKTGNVEIYSASFTLMKQLSVLLRRFGIWLRWHQKEKCATNGTKIKRMYYIGTFSGNSARIFCDYISFNVANKQNKLAKICQRNQNTNIEGIPASTLVNEMLEVSQLPIRHFGMHNTVYLNNSQQFSRKSLQKVVVHTEQILYGTSEKVYREKKKSRWTEKTLQAYAKLDKPKISNYKDKIQNLLDQEVFYCQIKSIEEIDYEGWVYDFEVANHHNFIANNIICHNTIQTIALLLHLKEQEDLSSPTLLVCPTSVLGNWEREVHRFTHDLSCLVHHGEKRKKGQPFVKQARQHDLIITSYALAQRDAKTLEKVSWEGVILDEAQNIKNPQAKQSKAVRNLEANFKIALTGTPLENRLSELWSIVDFLNPGYLGSQQFFQKRFANPIEKYNDKDSLQTLRSLVQPFILRRLKTDKEIIQDLPEKQEMNVYCGLSQEQAELYQQVVDSALKDIEDTEGIQRHGKILTLLMKLKQLCNHPALLQKEEDLIEANRSGKLLRLTEMLEELTAEKDRALIFTQFAEWGKLLQAYLQQTFNCEVPFLYGATRKKQREEMVDRFQNDPDAPPFFILSIKAGGTGLNLTRANHVFHVDRWWNPAVENQATDRAFRIGQKQNVQVHKFISTGTLEERINEMIESKKQLAEQTVDAGEDWLTQLDTEQLRDLVLLDRKAVIDS